MNQIMHLLTEHLFDYAGLFPPAQLSLPQALQNYFDYQSHAYHKMLGKFILPIKLADQYVKFLKEQNKEVPLSIILTGPTSFEEINNAIKENEQKIHSITQHLTNTKISSFEIAFYPDCYFQSSYDLSEHFNAIFKALSNALNNSNTNTNLNFELYCEVPYLEPYPLQNFLSFIKYFNQKNLTHKIFVKLRTGGVTPDLVPSVQKLAETIYYLGAFQLPFKVTAGLHIPTPNFNNAVGTTMHGYLNVFFTSLLSYLSIHNDADFNSENITQDVLNTILEKFDYTHLVVEDSKIFLSIPNNTHTKFLFTQDMIQNFRKNYFKGIGTCDFFEPIESLNYKIPFLA